MPSFRLFKKLCTFLSWIVVSDLLSLLLSPSLPPFLCFLSVCQIMSKGVVAVLGPSASPASNSIISNICGEKEVSLCTQLARNIGPMSDSLFMVAPETQGLEQ